MTAEWRVGRKLGRTLYVDDKLVGMVDTPEIAREIVETMNRVGRLLDEVRLVPTPDFAERVEALWHSLSSLKLEARPADAQRRSEATPQKDLP